MVILVPSILSANFANLEKDIRECEANGITMFHLDIMDGHFVPNISFGPIVVENIRRVTSAKLDSHLMIEHPEKYLDQFISAGSDIITIHIETIKDYRILKKAKNQNVKVGLAINPETDIKEIPDFFDYLDYILVMSVHPGFSGQKFILDSLSKIKKIKKLVDDYNHVIKIMVDGGVNQSNARSIIEAGAEYLVAASAIFNGNITENIKMFKSIL
ncbi:MAG: ribulose-phosphate 3-epimerase [Thermoplasmata archaeon]